MERRAGAAPYNSTGSAGSVTPGALKDPSRVHFRSFRTGRAGRHRHRFAVRQPRHGMLPLVLMFVVLYFVMIRPQMKRQKEHKTMIDALAKGDEVVTSGGLLGKISKIGDTFLSSRSPTASRSRFSARPSCRCCPRAPSSRSRPRCARPASAAPLRLP